MTDAAYQSASTPRQTLDGPGAIILLCIAAYLLVRGVYPFAATALDQNAGQTIPSMILAALAVISSILLLVGSDGRPLAILVLTLLLIRNGIGVYTLSQYRFREASIACALALGIRHLLRPDTTALLHIPPMTRWRLLRLRDAYAPKPFTAIVFVAWSAFNAVTHLAFDPAGA